MAKKEIHDKALSEVFEGTLDMEQIMLEEKNNSLDYAQSASDALTKGLTVATVSAVLAGELIIEKIKERKK